MRPFTLNLIWIKHRELIKVSAIPSERWTLLARMGLLWVCWVYHSLGLLDALQQHCKGQAVGCWSSVKSGARVFSCCFSSVTLSWRGGRRDEALGSLLTCHTSPYIWAGKAYRKFLRLVRFCPSAGSVIALTTLGLAVHSIKGVIIYN